MRAATSDARPPRFAAASLAMAVIALASLSFAPAVLGQPNPTTATTTAPAPTTVAPAPAGPVVVGATIVAELKAGRVGVIDATNKVIPLAKDLKSPNGVAALADGSVLIAESGAGRVVAVGGRFGLGREIVKDLDFPYGLTVGLDGTVYVSLLSRGEVGRIDVAAGRYTKLADGLKAPGDLTVRAGVLYVTESVGDATGGNDVVQIDKDGKKTVVAKGFQQPIGVAAGSGKTLFVTDLKAGKIVKIDDAGAKSDFVTDLDSPVQLAIEPYTPQDENFVLVVSTRTAVVRYDQAGKRLSSTTLEQPTGVAGVPASETPLVTPSTTTPASVVPGTSTPPSTRLRPTTTRATLPLDTDTSNTTSSNVLTLSLGVIGVLVVAVVVFLIVRKPKGGAAAGFEERPLDTYTVAEAFGPCAAEEVELAEAEGGIKSVVIQREAAEKRAADARERAEQARTELDALRAEAAPAAESFEPPPVVATPAPTDKTPARSRTQLRVQDLGLTTDAGRAALAAFARGELDAHALEARWIELGEQQAIDAVRGIGDAKTDPATADGAAGAAENRSPSDEAAAPSSSVETAAPDSRADAADAADAAAADAADAAEVDDDPTADAAATQEARLAERVEMAESDIEHADREIERLLEREAQAIERIAAARGALATCQAAHDAQAPQDGGAGKATPATGDADTRDQAPGKDASGKGAASDDAAPPAPSQDPPPPRPNFA